MAGSYSFLDVQLTIVGPGGAFEAVAIGESGIAEEGITFSMRDPKNTMSIGADGTPMHSLHASKGGSVMLRLQKTSPFNAVLDQMYRYQSASSAFWGRNLLSGSNPIEGTSFKGQACAFQKRPDWANATDAGTVEWVWDAGIIDAVLGEGLSY